MSRARATRAGTGWDSDPDTPSADMRDMRDQRAKKQGSGRPFRLERWQYLLLVLATIIVLLGRHTGQPGEPPKAPRRVQIKTSEQQTGGQATKQPGEAAKKPQVAGPGGKQLTSLLEEQLYYCNTVRTDPIPKVDTKASLKVLDTYSDKQRKQAKQFTAAVSACKDFACLRKANKLPRAPGQFRYPHFFVIGFPKCATTSLYCHLIQHPQVQYPKEKESHTLTQGCASHMHNCSAAVQQKYVVDILNMAEAAQSQFTRAAFEGSTHYVLADTLAEQLATTFPWLKVVIAMRDPLSQAIAMHLHNLKHDREGNCSADPTDTSIFHCIRRSLKPGSKSQYGPKVEAWMRHFPKNQLQVVQFESLTSPDHMAADLRTLKSFLGIDPQLPNNKLPLSNVKHQSGKVGQYWMMKRWELDFLLDMARNNTQEVVDLLKKHGYVNKAGQAAWWKNWESVWQANLGRCEHDGRAAPCKVIVS